MEEEVLSNAAAIARFAHERQITRLVHFTPFLNLLGIFDLRGIKPRDEISAYAQEHKDEDLMAYISWNDKLRLDRRTDCVNLSIQRINAPLFSRFKDGFESGEPWCIFEIDPSCLQKDGVMFTVANAAATAVRQNGTAGGIAGLRALYQNVITVPKFQGVSIYRRTSRTPPSCTTSVQAEVLYPGEIPLEKIMGMIFESEEAATRAKVMLQVTHPDLKLPPVKVAPAEFGAYA